MSSEAEREREVVAADEDNHAYLDYLLERECPNCGRRGCSGRGDTCGVGAPA